MKTKPNGWVPIRKDAIYCSAACGGGCTWNAFRGAQKQAEALCKKLGHGFKPKVWENLGWYWTADSASMGITIWKVDGGFFAQVHNGNYFRHKTAVGAILAAREHAEDTAFKINQALCNLRKFQPPKAKKKKP